MSLYSVTVVCRPYGGTTTLLYTSSDLARDAYTTLALEGSVDIPATAKDSFGKTFSVMPQDISTVTMSDVEAELRGINALKLLQVRAEVDFTSAYNSDEKISAETRRRQVSQSVLGNGVMMGMKRQ